MDKINGSGVMLFISRPTGNLVFFLRSIRSGGPYLEDLGGVLESKLTTMQNALKELFEETFASVKTNQLVEEQAVVVNNKYKCYPLYIRVDDLNFFKDVVEMNRKILQTTKLKSFKEGVGYQLVDLKTLLQSDMKHFIVGENQGQQNNTLKIHQRAQDVLKVLLSNGIVSIDGQVHLECRQCVLDKLDYPNTKDQLNVLHKQLTYLIQ